MVNLTTSLEYHLVCVTLLFLLSSQVELGQSVAGGRMLGAGSLRTVLREVISSHGYSGLFTGLTPRVAKIAPACAIMISSYEACKEYFRKQNSTEI